MKKNIAIQLPKNLIGKEGGSNPILKAISEPNRELT
jgi:hypothetical protein